MFRMFLRIIAFAECVRINVDSSPLLWGNDTATLQLGNDTTISPETMVELLQPSENYIDTVEGDEMSTLDRNAVNNIWKRTKDVNGSFSVKIPYLIKDDLSHKKGTILDAMKMISDEACVSFHEWNEEREDAGEHDYLVFTNHPYGCASYVGCIGGPQTLYVGPSCNKGNVCHEILHALGLHHEQTRPDHSTYIEIIYPNIMEKMKKNFDTIHGNTLNSSYDTCSIMHYGSHYFSANGLPTIVEKTKTGECVLGQRTELSELDIKKICTLYGCDCRDEVAT